jgi:hypothetical protein
MHTYNSILYLLLMRVKKVNFLVRTNLVEDFVFSLMLSQGVELHAVHMMYYKSTRIGAMWVWVRERERERGGIRDATRKRISCDPMSNIPDRCMHAILWSKSNECCVVSTTVVCFNLAESVQDYIVCIAE